MSAITSLTAQAAGADNGVAVTMLGKGLSSAKDQAASLLSVLPQPPKVNDQGRLDGYA